MQHALVVEKLLAQTGMAPDELVEGRSEAAPASLRLDNLGFDEPA